MSKHKLKRYELDGEEIVECPRGRFTLEEATQIQKQVKEDRRIDEECNAAIRIAIKKFLK